MTLRRIASIAGLYDDTFFAPRTELRPASSFGLLRMAFDPNAIPIPIKNRPKTRPRPKADRSNQKCLIPGCEREVRASGLCKPHSNYTATCKHQGCARRVKKRSKTQLCVDHARSFSGHRVAKVDRGSCYVNGCTTTAAPNGRCRRHRNHTRTCSVQGCAVYVSNGNRSGLCRQHSGEVRR